MSKKLSFKEALERQERDRTEPRSRSAFPAVKAHLRRTAPISRPIDLARLLVSCGLSLRKAHEAVNRLAEGKTVALDLACPDIDQSIDQLAELGVDARRVKMPEVDPLHVRRSFGLTQPEFADRFLLNVDTIRNWEQGRNVPDPSARLLLKVIEEYPQVIEAILGGYAAACQESAYRISFKGVEVQRQVAIQTYTSAIIQVWRALSASLAAPHRIDASLSTHVNAQSYSWVVEADYFAVPPHRQHAATR